MKSHSAFKHCSGDCINKGHGLFPPKKYYITLLNCNKVSKSKCQFSLFIAVYTGCPPPQKKCIHTLTADRTILKMKCILINIAFIIVQSVCVRFGRHPRDISNEMWVQRVTQVI